MKNFKIKFIICFPPFIHSLTPYTIFHLQSIFTSIVVVLFSAVAFQPILYFFLAFFQNNTPPKITIDVVCMSRLRAIAYCTFLFQVLARFTFQFRVHTLSENHRGVQRELNAISSIELLINAPITVSITIALLLKSLMCFIAQIEFIIDQFSSEFLLPVYRAVIILFVKGSNCYFGGLIRHQIR